MTHLSEFQSRRRTRLLASLGFFFALTTHFGCLNMSFKITMQSVWSLTVHT